MQEFCVRLWTFEGFRPVHIFCVEAHSHRTKAKTKISYDVYSLILFPSFLKSFSLSFCFRLVWIALLGQQRDIDIARRGALSSAPSPLPSLPCPHTPTSADNTWTFIILRCNHMDRWHWSRLSHSAITERARFMWVRLTRHPHNTASPFRATRHPQHHEHNARKFRNRI